MTTPDLEHVLQQSITTKTDTTSGERILIRNNQTLIIVNNIKLIINTVVQPSFPD